jgi:lipid-A-disaccharide synthase
MSSETSRTILLTAFEPSGDRLGASLVRAVLARDPSIRFVAYGGQEIERAGAELVEDTCANPVMGLPGPRVIASHLALNRRIGARMDAMLRGEGLDLHIAVDSPAANFPACKQAKRRGVRVVHLAAPQLWAWAPWRIRKLRRLTNKVLCLLPFEEEWFGSRGVPATFIGHPIFDTEIDGEALEAIAGEYPEGGPRIALLPGSRSKEQRLNFLIQLETFIRLRKKYPKCAGVVAAVNEAAADRLRYLASNAGGWPEGLVLRIGEVEAVLHWAEVCLTVSGTVTLQVLRHAVPMVVHYKANRVMYNLLARWLLIAEHLSLPNLVAGKRIVTELMPYFGDADRLFREADALLSDEAARERVGHDLQEAGELFAGRDASSAAAEEVLGMLGDSANGPGGT